jgi:AcrR family transcriptional regulator
MRGSITQTNDFVNQTDDKVHQAVYAARMSRRSPAPDERRRDADRTREALLDAALAEFGAKGLAGARTSEIAARAGVNKQLISYYFGGKDGLYKAILDRWYAQEAQLSEPGISLAELAYRYLEAGVRQPDLQRLFIREEMEADPDSVARDPDSEDLADLRARKQAGEIAEELDPAFVLLVLQAAVVSGIVFPRDVKRLMGLAPDSPEYLEHMGEQLRRLVRRLA